MKVAMIGLGDIAQKAYLPVLAQLPDVELILCTRNQHTLQHWLRVTESARRAPTTVMCCSMVWMQ